MRNETITLKIWIQAEKELLDCFENWWLSRNPPLRWVGNTRLEYGKWRKEFEGFIGFLCDSGAAT